MSEAESQVVTYVTASREMTNWGFKCGPSSEARRETLRRMMEERTQGLSWADSGSLVRIADALEQLVMWMDPDKRSEELESRMRVRAFRETTVHFEQLRTRSQSRIRRFLDRRVEEIKSLGLPKDVQAYLLGDIRERVRRFCAYREAEDGRVVHALLVGPLSELSKQPMMSLGAKRLQRLDQAIQVALAARESTKEEE